MLIDLITLNRQITMFFILVSILSVFYIALCESKIDPKIEEAFIEDIRNFLRYEEDILKHLKRFKNNVENSHKKAVENKNYSENSTHRFLIVKRLVMDWHFITALASFNKRKFLAEIQKDISIIQQHPDFPTLRNLTDTVLKIADAQEKQGINSVGEFVMTLTNDPYTKLTASECSVFAEVLKGVNKDTLAKLWETESRTLQDVFEDPLMEIYAIKK